MTIVSVVSVILLYSSICTLVLCTDGSLLRAAKHPILLHLNPHVGKDERTSNNTTTRPVKSKPSFFQEALGIVPGDVFSLNLESWRDLKESGLYHNLTARPVVRNDEIYLDIQGTERESIEFAPEISVHDISSQPEIRGGVIFHDKNFLGRGQGIEFMLTKREDQRMRTDLPASLRAKWSDSVIGKESKVSIGLNDDHSLEYARAIRPTSTKAESSNERIHTSTTKLYSLFGWSPRSLQKRLTVEIEPYITSFKQGFKSSSLEYEETIVNGALATVNHRTRSGNSFLGWIDSGSSLFRSKSLPGDSNQMPFCQFGFEAKSRLYSITPFPTVDKPVDTTLPANDSSRRTDVSFLGRAQFKHMRCQGSGDIPLLHHARLSESNYVRGMHDEAVGNMPMDSVRHSEYNVVKADLSVRGLLKSFQPGVFCDAALYRHRPRTELKRAATVGLSLRMYGLRADLGWPVASGMGPKFFLGLDVNE